MRRWHRNWSDNQRQLGPFIWAFQRDWRPFGLMLMLDSGNPVDEYKPNRNLCTLRIYLYWFVVLVCLPPILKPYQAYKTFRHHRPDGSVSEGGYWDVHSREFGAYFTDRFSTIHAHYGAQTHDSETDRGNVFFLPWAQWRMVRHSLYEPDGRLFWTGSGRWRLDEENSWDVKRRCPAMVFRFTDYDGEEGLARCVIEEREWHRGTGWFKWLGRIWPKQVARSLDIEFSIETGPRKGSWKGGTVGAGIDMRPDEHVAGAFVRYCQNEKRKLEYRGVARPSEWSEYLKAQEAKREQNAVRGADSACDVQAELADSGDAPRSG